VATPVAVSTSSRLVQPLVAQYGVLAVEVRRRSRRMADDRPATVEVMVRVSIV
jgi:hypothetical protein